MQQARRYDARHRLLDIPVRLLLLTSILMSFGAADQLSGSDPASLIIGANCHGLCHRAPLAVHKLTLYV